MTNTNLKFSRIPVYQNEINGITGMVLKDDVFKEMAFNHGDKKLSDIKRELPIVDRNIPIPELFEQLIEKKQHMALVVDEYGTVSGIVTQEDVIETLLGLEIMDESDSVADLQHLARKNWKIRSRSISGEDDNPQKE